MLVTFLYTNCPDVCPLITSNLRVAQNLMGAEDGLESADHRRLGRPARRHAEGRRGVPRAPRDDRADAVPDRLRRTNSRRVWQAWGVGSERDAQQPQFINHSGLVYGITGSGKRITVYDATFKPARNRARRAAARRALSVAAMQARQALGWTLAAAAAVTLLAVFGLASSPSQQPARRAGAAAANSWSAHRRRSRACSPAPTGAPSRSSSGRAGARRAGTRRPRSSASRRAPTGRGRIVGVDWSDGLSGARSFIRHYALELCQPARRRRHGRQRLRAAGPADDVRARQPRADPHDARGPQDGKLAAGRSGCGGTQLSWRVRRRPESNRCRRLCSASDSGALGVSRSPLRLSGALRRRAKSLL